MLSHQHHPFCHLCIRSSCCICIILEWQTPSHFNKTTHVHSYHSGFRYIHCTTAIAIIDMVVVANVVIIINSTNVGGHTAEMLNLVAVLQKDKYTPRFYIAALTDNMSLQKAQVLEESLAHQVLFISF